MSGIVDVINRLVMKRKKIIRGQLFNDLESIIHLVERSMINKNHA
jgi:hypothetical protein